VVIFGLILLLIGFVTGITILWTIGMIVLIVGLVLWLLGRWGTQSEVDGTTTDLQRRRVLRRNRQIAWGFVFAAGELISLRASRR